MVLGFIFACPNYEATESMTSTIWCFALTITSYCSSSPNAERVTPVLYTWMVSPFTW